LQLVLDKNHFINYDLTGKEENMERENQSTEISVGKVFSYEEIKSIRRPLMGSRIAAGFPSPAQDYIEDVLDLNELLIKHPAATYFVRVEGYSMINAGIFPEDILVVDRSLEPASNRIVIAVIDGELTVKRLFIDKQSIYYLLPENPDFKPIRITEDMNFSVWGVVSNVIHKV